MLDIINTTIAPELAIASQDLDQLRASIQGQVFLPEDDGYNAARAGFSLADQPAPSVVIVAATAGDIVEAVNFARINNLPIGVKATGHNFGYPYRGGIMINTEKMKCLHLDPAARTVRVEAGVTWRDVIQEAHPYGLAPLSGSSPDIGVIGYTVFGGIGWMVRKYGAAVDSMRSADIVTAGGQLLHVDAQHHADLFWGLRGGGGNYGIITALEVELYPVSEIYGGSIFFPMEQAREVLTAYSRWVETVPDELTSTISLMQLPPLPFVPAPLRGRKVIVVRAVYIGNEQDGAALLKPISTLGGVIANTFGMLPFTEIGTVANDPTHPTRSYRSTTLLADLGPDTIETLLAVAGAGSPSPLISVEIRQLGGALARMAEDTTAFSQRHAPFALSALGAVIGYPGEPVDFIKQYPQVVLREMQPHSTGGVFPGWLGDGDYGVERTRAGYSQERYRRLVALKERYDPDNMFRLNHNIPPVK